MQQSTYTTIISSLVHYYDGLTDYLSYRFGCKIFAQDVIQDVCVKLMERPQAENIQYPIAFLRKISHDTAVDRVREQDTRKKWLDAMVVLPDAICDAPTQFQIFAAKQTFNCLVEAIQALPPRCQEVFILHKIHEIPQADVAKKLGISKKAVEKHIKLGTNACLQYMLNAIGGHTLL